MHRRTVAVLTVATLLTGAGCGDPASAPGEPTTPEDVRATAEALVSEDTPDDVAANGYSSDASHREGDGGDGDAAGEVGSIPTTPGSNDRDGTRLGLGKLEICRLTHQVGETVTRPVESLDEALKQSRDLAIAYAQLAQEFDGAAAHATHELALAAEEAHDVIEAVIASGATTLDALRAYEPELRLNQAFTAYPLIGLPETVLAVIDERCEFGVVAEQRAFLALEVARRDLVEAALALHMQFTERQRFSADDLDFEPSEGVSLRYHIGDDGMSFCIEATHQDVLEGREVAASYDMTVAHVAFATPCLD